MGRGEEYEFLLFYCIKLAQQDQAYPRAAERQKAERKRGDRFQLQQVCTCRLAGDHCPMPADSGDECLKVLHVQSCEI